MPSLKTTAAAVGFALSILPTTLSAQIDYRNLDDGRPVTTEDAYPVEHYAFEALVPYLMDRDQGGAVSNLFLPELEYGAFPNSQLAIRALIAGASSGGAGTRWGLAGLQIAGLYNFNTESPSLPALSLRGELSLPAGSLAGRDTRFTLKAIATRSWGITRVHLNLARGIGRENAPAAIPSTVRTAGSFAVDRTFFRQSILVVGELAALERRRGAPTEVDASLGARYQWTPTTVLDLGAARRLGAHGPDFALTFGISHAFAFRGLMPAGRR